MKSARLLCTLFVLLPVFAVRADDDNSPERTPTGTWRLDYDFQGRAIHDEIRLHLREKGKVTGKLFRNQRKPIEVADGTFSKKDSVVSFSISGNANGTEWRTVYKGKVKGDEIEGGTVVLTYNNESYEFPWRPKRVAEMDDLVGRWNLRVEAPDGTVFEPALIVREKDDGFESEYTSPRADEIEIRRLEVKESEMRLTISVEYEGQVLIVKYRGRPYGDSINGAFTYEIGDETGEGKFTAKRMPAETSPVD
ncbi:MAG: hypothetical protein AAFU85_24680 [Planctomycetota bacterium]